MKGISEPNEPQSRKEVVLLASVCPGGEGWNNGVQNLIIPSFLPITQMCLASA